MTDDSTYEEKISSNRTEVLFIALMLLFLLLFAWRVTAIGIGPSTVVFFCLFSMFLFYSLNYRVLIIRITSRVVELKFGIFTWSIPLNTIEGCYLDNTSMWRISGAGIHFTVMKKRYRAMFNFLEHQRVVLLLSKKKGLVQEIAFSTRQPEEVKRIITKRRPDTFS